MWLTPLLFLSLYVLNSLFAFWFALNTHNCFTTETAVCLLKTSFSARGELNMCLQYMKKKFCRFSWSVRTKMTEMAPQLWLNYSRQNMKGNIFLLYIMPHETKKKVCLFTWIHCEVNVCCCSCKRLTIVERVRREKLLSSSVLGYFIIKVAEMSGVFGWCLILSVDICQISVIYNQALSWFIFPTVTMFTLCDTVWRWDTYMDMHSWSCMQVTYISAMSINESTSV